ncbi:AarF/UbiB family protein [Sphingobacterium spiritivorum]|uniref:ABC1 family protein n=1 Tax=Sphingobacterium spiritivorum ATCC 33861 TaxID=525373 RepID=D7VM00_SPHSI|nr:AarF/UbiB family protein [Sphingobacterium spiritivorum]EFK58005.1 ABC1 family protein [Sphingobacterium spiritivorum ATCC 33861]QQT34733.1 AarF/ABC1/UbiB kinase family protein [Sphingobacterium spiritivorum]WQD35617.1 AarF/UbiB family protein [Sphingobacterium spiritivorum]SUJ01163.1 Probable ubiquinone biosynthesis protein UbiB [Sphingobacterium spiritivorum]
MIYEISKIKRVGRIAKILSQYGFGELISRSNIDTFVPDSLLHLNSDTEKLFEKDFNVRVRLAIEELGPTFIKLGQLLSNREDIIPKDLRDELVKLQDNVPPEEMDVRQKLREHFDIVPEDHFEYIDEKPLAAASIGQVYKVRLKSGKEAVLKIKRSNIREVITADLAFIKDLTKFLESKYEVIYKMNLYQIILSFENSLMRELSFVNELNNMERFRKNFKDNIQIYVPKVYRAYSDDEMLCMEFIDGVKINDVEGLKALGLAPKSIVQQGLDLYLEQVLVHGFFHADPHPGNVFVNKKGQIVFIDFGAMGMMIPMDRKLIEAMVINFLMKDARDLIRNIKKLAVVQHIEDERRLERDAYEIFDILDQNSLANIEISVLLRMVNNTLQHNHILMPDFIYILIRGIVLLEGIGRQLDADLNIPKSISPFADRIAKQKISPGYLREQTIEKAKFLKGLWSDIPEDALALLDKVKNDKILLNHRLRDFDSFQLILHRMGNKLMLSILAMTFGIGSSILAHGRVGYLLWDVPLLSWLGFLMSFLLTVALLLQLFRSK